MRSLEERTTRPASCTCWQRTHDKPRSECASSQPLGPWEAAAAETGSGDRATGFRRRRCTHWPAHHLDRRLGFVRPVFRGQLAAAVSVVLAAAVRPTCEEHFPPPPCTFPAFAKPPHSDTAWVLEAQDRGFASARSSRRPRWRRKPAVGGTIRAAGRPAVPQCGRRSRSGLGQLPRKLLPTTRTPNLAKELTNHI